MRAQSPRVWVPLLLFALLQVAVLLLLGNFTAPGIRGFMIPIVERLGGEVATHYPNHYVLLPTMYQLVYLPLIATLGFILFGVAVGRMRDHIARIDEISFRPRASVGATILPLVVIGIIYVALVMAAPTASAYLAQQTENPMAQRGLRMGAMVITVLLQVFLIHGIARVVAGTTNPFSALAEGMAVGRSNFLLTALVVTTVLVLHLPVNYLLEQSDSVAVRFRPELVLVLLLAGVAVELLTNLFLFASSASIAFKRVLR